MRLMSRRSLLRAGASMGAVTLMGSPAFAQKKKLRMYFWGSKDRADRTAAANALYVKKNAGTTIDSEFLGWGDYWSRMATQAARKGNIDTDAITLGEALAILTKGNELVGFGKLSVKDAARAGDDEIVSTLERG